MKSSIFRLILAVVVAVILLLPLWVPIVVREDGSDAVFLELYAALRAAGIQWDATKVQSMGRVDALAYLTALRDGREVLEEKQVLPSSKKERSFYRSDIGDQIQGKRKKARGG